MHRFDDKTIKTTQNYENYRRWIASIWRQNDQKCLVTSQIIENNSKLQKYSNYTQFALIRRLNDQNVELRRKTFKTTLNYKSAQTTMTCIDLMTKRSKQRKTTKAIELRWIASIWRQNDQKCFVTSQNIENNSKLQMYSNYEEFASISSRNDKKYWLTSQTVQNKAKLIKLIKVQWIASIGCQNDQNNAKLQKWSKYNDLHRFDDKTIKTTQYYENYRRCIPSIWWQNILNNAKLRKRSNYNDLHRFDDKTIKTTQNYENYRRWIASIWWQNILNNAKLQTRSNYNELHRFDVKTIKNVELRRKTFKTTLNYKSAQTTMTCIDLMTKRSKQR